MIVASRRCGRYATQRSEVIDDLQLALVVLWWCGVGCKEKREDGGFGSRTLGARTPKTQCIPSDPSPGILGTSPQDAHLISLN